MLNDTQIGDIWVLFTDFIDKKQVEAAAERYVDLLADFGVSDKVLQSVNGVDPILDQAINFYLDEDIEQDEDQDYDELDF